MNPSTEKLRDAAATAAGIILVLSPLALWVAWTETMFLATLAVVITSGTLFCVLSRDGAPDSGTRHTRSGSDSRVVSTDEFLAELSALGPWTYHHRRPGDPVFGRKIDRLVERGTRRRE